MWIIRVYGQQLKVTDYRGEGAGGSGHPWSDIWDPGLVKGMGAALAAPDCPAVSRRIPSGSLRRSRSVWQRSRGSASGKAMEIAEQMEEKKDMRKAMIYLQKYGISPRWRQRSISYYGNRMYQVLWRKILTSWRMISSGVGFKTADEIAAKIGIHTDSDYRIRSGIILCAPAGRGRGTYLSAAGAAASEAQAAASGSGDRSIWKNIVMDLCHGEESW